VDILQHMKSKAKCLGTSGLIIILKIIIKIIIIIIIKILFNENA